MDSQFFFWADHHQFRSDCPFFGALFGCPLLLDDTILPLQHSPFKQSLFDSDSYATVKFQYRTIFLEMEVKQLRNLKRGSQDLILSHKCRPH